jgi:hypothetical protein
LDIYGTDVLQILILFDILAFLISYGLENGLASI